MALRQEEIAAWWLHGKLLLLAPSVVLYAISLRLVGRPMPRTATPAPSPSWIR